MKIVCSNEDTAKSIRKLTRANSINGTSSSEIVKHFVKKTTKRREKTIAKLLLFKKLKFQRKIKSKA